MAKKETNSVKKETCFVIMPFSTNWSNDYYSAIYSPAVLKAGLEPHRADDLFAPNTVVQDIWNYTQNAQIILADLTGKNPNVFYELGLAHAIAKPVILVTESEEDIPFDLRAIRIIKYDKNKHDWGEQLRCAITQSIQEILKNPQASIPSPFLKTSKGHHGLTLTDSDKKLVELSQDVELLKKQVRSRPGVIRDRIDPSQAREKIRRYLEIGMPAGYVIERIARLGPPVHWIKNEIAKLQPQNPSTS